MKPGDLSINVPDTSINNSFDRGRFVGAAPRFAWATTRRAAGASRLRNVSGADCDLDIAHRRDGGHVETSG